MASTSAPHKKSAKKFQKPEADQPMLRDQQLATELSKFYGVDLNEDTDHDQFIKEIVKAHQEAARQDQQEDPVEAAIFSEKLGELRKLWHEDDDSELTEDQQKLKDKLVKEYPGSSITFKDDTWTLQVKGKEDSGHTSIPHTAIIASAERMSNPPAAE